jgi:hypothetical protein
MEEEKGREGDEPQQKEKPAEQDDLLYGQLLQNNIIQCC